MPLSPSVYRFVNVPFVLLSHTKFVGQNVFTFRVPPQITKPEIKSILEKMYGLRVKKVNTLNYGGKYKRNGHNKGFWTKRYKKAYVTVEGEDVGSAMVAE